jgi:PAS domain S-box-containing protein
MGSEKVFQDLPETYRVIFENTGTAMVVISEDMKIILANSELEKLIGYSKREVEEKRLWSDFVHCEDLARMKDYHRRRRCGDADVPSRYSFRMLDRQNQLKDISVNVAMLPGTSHSIASLIDISDLKRVERALRESEKRYRVLVEDMPALICRFHSDGTLTFVNQAYCRYFDRSAEELLGYNFFHFIPEEDQESVREHFLSLNRQRPMITYEHKVMDQRGEVRWQQWTDRAIFSEEGELVEFQSLGQDVTERKLAEEEKERLQVRLQQAQRMEAVGRLTAGFAHDCNNISCATGYRPKIIFLLPWSQSWMLRAEGLH